MTALTTAAFENARAEQAETGPFLRDLWYYAAPGAVLKHGTTKPVQMLGEPLLLGRAADGAVFALRDICPHRGIPLRYGRFDGREVECCYHGWRFDTSGQCTAIPSLMPEQGFDISRIKCRSYPCREAQGNIWVYFGRGRRATQPDALPLPPQVAGFDGLRPQVYIHEPFPCDADHAAFGLMDPTHAAFVHTSRWWKRSARTLRPKEKSFEPAPLGWRMTRHRLPPENRAYRILGRNVTTEITYSLPGIRIERIEGERHRAVSLTAITPVNERETEVHQCLYWSVPWMAPLRPLAKRLARIFLNQDKRVVVLQQEGLAHDPTLMLIDDADTQAKWFARCKREYLRAQADDRPFQNPVKPCTLRWHS